MADESEKPLAKLNEAEKTMAKGAQVAAEPTDARARLRAFEDEVFGKDAVRINGEVERGIGSPHHKMKPGPAAKYAALERLIQAEDKAVAARAAVQTAEHELHAAELAVDAAETASE